jgi:integrase
VRTSWLRAMVKDMPDGPLMPGLGGKAFQTYNAVYLRFVRTAEVAGIPDGFTPHSLRHASASAMLARGVPITELARFLGHRDINVTHQLYGHLLPSAAKPLASRPALPGNLPKTQRVRLIEICSNKP